MNPSILLVEDNEQNRYLATFLLENEGCRVVHAGNGREALRALDSEKFDVVLMDIQMPEMDGFECLDHIRTRSAITDLPVLAVTSFASEADRKKAIEAGFAGYLEKPIDIDLFFDQIKSYLPERNRAS
ncbi:MAG: response regulator [Chthoniobacteraceae bacterium]